MQSAQIPLVAVDSRLALVCTRNGNSFVPSAKNNLLSWTNNADISYSCSATFVSSLLLFYLSSTLTVARICSMLNVKHYDLRPQNKMTCNNIFHTLLRIRVCHDSARCAFVLYTHMYLIKKRYILGVNWRLLDLYHKYLNIV